MKKLIVYKKLDIVSYVRSMILFDLLNNIMLNENKITILNFLSRPTISLNRDIEYPVLEFYQNYTKNDFEKYCETISALSQNANKEIEEKKLIVLSNKQLKDSI